LVKIMPNSTEDQAQRRHAIRQLLLGGPAETQQVLVGELNARGFVATQSSVSRDLKELGAIKTHHGYELPDGKSVKHKDELAGVADLLRTVSPAGPNLIVIKTAIGAAQRVALALDRSNWSEMIGNIGGDDTVFVATDSTSSQKILISRIERAGSRS
jgi:transcriptional regulator of arginine metabolism